MFGSESCLHGLYKLAHGTKHLGEQIAYWYTIHRAIHSLSITNQPSVVHHGHLIDGYIDEQIIQQYQQQFDHAFFLKFSCMSDRSVVFRSRYKIGLITYHSLLYSFRKQSSSFNVCVSNSHCSKKKCFGEVVFFFSYQDELFLFLSSHPCSQSHLFSSAIPVDEHLPFWSDRIDSFYYLVHKNIDTFSILPCTALLSKFFFFPFHDGRFTVCTPIDNELEHN
jgi:hypothetical protein